ncbi:MAG: nucleotidyltransferase family protein [Bacteroidales bacterium]|nr:nucleotidyltransferase family protein [Bacteroidales bacterium]
MKAMVLAAGLGTRLKPLTDNKPKALVEINGKTQLELVINRLSAFGFKDVVVNVHHYAEMIIEYLKKNNNFGSSITISDERDKLMDTGGGIFKAAKFLKDGDPILVHNVDVYTNINLISLYNSHKKSNALATLAVKKRKTSRPYLVNSRNQICGWQNILTGETKLSRPDEDGLTPLAYSCIHVVNPEIFLYMDSNEPFSITQLYLELSKTKPIEVYKHDNDIWLDLGSLDNLKIAEEYI